MRRLLFVLPALLLAASSCGGGKEEFHWQRIRMDGSLTGVQACTATDVAEKLGVIDSISYKAPAGHVFDNESATYKAARLLLGAQDRMAALKAVIGYSRYGMDRYAPECELGDWFIDELMRAAQEISGKKIHFGITNFGGIRVDMPRGDVLKDDIISMFPFKNNLCYLELYGRDIRVLLEQLASTKWQVVGGARCTVKDGKLVSAEIDGAPLDDDRVYGVATISFLLNGGDGISVARNARCLDIFPVYIIDVMLPYVLRLTANGETIDYQKDGRIQILSSEDR